MVNSFCVIESSVWFHLEEIYKDLYSLPLSYTATPDEVPACFIQKVAIAISYPSSTSLMLAVPQVNHSTVGNMLSLHQYQRKTTLFASNYRPISITSAFARAFERKLKSCLITYLGWKSLLSEDEHGFRGGGLPKR